MHGQKEPNLHADLLHTCAWCTERIPEDEERFAFGARVSPGIELGDKEGQFVSLVLALAHKTVIALVPTHSSQASTAGYDLVFITCSEACTSDLKEALQLEKDVFED